MKSVVGPLLNPLFPSTPRRVVSIDIKLEAATHIGQIVVLWSSAPLGCIPSRGTYSQSHLPWFDCRRSPCWSRMRQASSAHCTTASFFFPLTTASATMFCPRELSIGSLKTQPVVWQQLWSQGVWTAICWSLYSGILLGSRSKPTKPRWMDGNNFTKTRL